MGRLIALTLALLMGVLLAWVQLRLPEPAPLGAPSREFSAERALRTVRLMAQAPHPIGSAENRRVRDRLLAQMRVLGMETRTRRGDTLVVRSPARLVGASPESLIGVLPGRDRAPPAVALMAHYDSRPGAPGAADDAAGAAAALEVVRAIAARGVPARDVAVILTDGEEAGCLCGARELLARDPIAPRLGLVVNLEARGSTGRALMFQTGQRSGEAMRLFRETAQRPVTGSLFQEVYARLPNDTDFTLVRAAGIAGLNFAFTGGQADYHQPTDSVANLDRGSLQDLGAQALAVAGAAAAAPHLPEAAPDLSYGVIFGPAMLLYPPAWGWAVLASSATLLALALRGAHRREALSGLDVARGLAAGLYAVAATAVFLHLAQAAASAFDPLGVRRTLVLVGRFEAALLMIAVGGALFAAAEAARGRRIPGVLAPVLAAVVSCALARAPDIVAIAEGLTAAALGLAVGRGPIGRPAAWAGLLVLGLALGVTLQVAAPLAAYVIAWPLALAALAAAATDLAADRRVSRLLVLAVAGLLVAGWAGVQAHLIVVVTGLAELLALPMLMGALALWPLAQPEDGAPPARLPGRILLLAGAALVLVVRFGEPWSLRHPHPSEVTYLLDQSAGRAWRVTPERLRTPWSDAALRQDGGAIAPLRHWAWPAPLAAAPAALATLAPPTVTSTREADGAVLVTLVAPPGVRALALQLTPSAPAQLQAVGQAPASASLTPGAITRLYWSAPPEAGLTLRLLPQGPGEMELRYSLMFEGWAPGVPPPPPPPPGVMAVELSGSAAAMGVSRIRW